MPALASAMNTRRAGTCRSVSRSPRTSQRRNPPSSIASAIARSRCVRNAASSASTCPGSRIRGSVRAVRTSGTPWPLPLPPGRQPTRHRVGGDVATDVQEREQPRHARQPPPHGPRRHPGTVTDGLHTTSRTAGVLGGDECQHVGDHPPRWLAHHGEKPPSGRTRPPRPCSVGNAPPRTPDTRPATPHRTARQDRQPRSGTDTDAEHPTTYSRRSCARRATGLEPAHTLR
jgi:hypothetical protein